MKPQLKFALLLMLLTAVLTACATPQATPGTADARIWVLDDADPDFSNPPYEDALVVLDSTGAEQTRISGLNMVKPLGGQRLVSVSPAGDFALVIEAGSGRLARYNADSSIPVWLIARDFTAVELAADGYAYALSGDPAGEQLLLKLDVNTGQSLAEAALSGLDLVVDVDHDIIWLVGTDVTKLNLALEPQFTLDVIGWQAVAVDRRSTGGVWVAEQANLAVPGSANRLIHLTKEGGTPTTVDLPLLPMAIAVDRSDDSIWVAMNISASSGKLVKYDSMGAELLTVETGGVWSVSVNQTDGSIWAGGRDGRVYHYDRLGSPLAAVAGFSARSKYIGIQP
ncbi:MAG TPA: hypothetical protein PKH92_14735 [Anaerolineaceae bacterium]|jgi:hypothetical protein|nr:hypothetical protein [Anaerolineaceae bacterium]HOG79426.1 hypothetical protein [Anaerolineaceae bacterium]